MEYSASKALEAVLPSSTLALAVSLAKPIFTTYITTVKPELLDVSLNLSQV
jgi:hypothetical protein